MMILQDIKPFSVQAGNGICGMKNAMLTLVLE